MVKMVSYYDKALGISLEMPSTWETGRSEDFPLVILGPETQDYRSNLSFDRTPLAVPDPERLAEIIAATHEDQKRDYPDFVQANEERLFIDQRPAYWQEYTWTAPETNRRYTQVFGLIVTDPDHVIDFHGATLPDLQDEYIPLFRRIVDSIRIIPGD